MTRTVLMTMSLLGGLCAAACGSAETAAVAVDQSALTASQTRTWVEIENAVAQVCNLPNNQTYFGYDSSDVDRTDDQMIRRVAECMTDGQLRGQRLVIVGTGDEGGTTAYDDSLGMSRAEQIARHLASYGVDRDRIQVRAHVDRQVGHTDNESWAMDRKVEIQMEPVY